MADWKLVSSFCNSEMNAETLHALQTSKMDLFLVVQTESKCYFCTYHIWMCVIMVWVYLCVCLLIAKEHSRTGV